MLSTSFEVRVLVDAKSDCELTLRIDKSVVVKAFTSCNAMKFIPTSRLRLNILQFEISDADSR